MTVPNLPIHILLVAALCSGMILSYVVVRSWRTCILKRRFRRGIHGEAVAERYLQRHGFTIIASQSEKKTKLTIDGEDREYALRTDFLVLRKGKRCIVEAKSGAKATDPLYSDTRRQLLEYAVVYKTDRVYLFDAEHLKLREIRFPMLQSRWQSQMAYFLVGMLTGLSTGIILLVLR